MLRFRVIAVVALAGLLAALGAACGGDDDDSDTGATAAPTSAQSGQTPATQPTAAASPAASNAAVVKVGNNVKFGSILTSADGLTLYTFTQDGPGKSNCSGSCAATWPPLTTTAATAPKVDGAPGEFSLLTREDGTKQVAYNGKPLYRYGPDKAPGDANGQAVGNVWFVATAAAPAATPAASGTAASGADNPYGY